MLDRSPNPGRATRPGCFPDHGPELPRPPTPRGGAGSGSGDGRRSGALRGLAGSGPRADRRPRLRGLTVGISVVAGSLFLGTIVGSLAGYYGGLIDRFINVIVMNAFLSFPGILLAIAFVAFLGPGLWNLILALIIGGWVGYARLVRAQVLAAREREYVEAARALGASDFRILARHILPNIMQPVIVQAAIGMASAILAEGTMSFLGLGVPPPVPSWGAMLNDGRSHLFDSPHVILFPALTVMLAVLAFNFVGDAMRDFLDPRSRIEAGL